MSVILFYFLSCVVMWGTLCFCFAKISCMILGEYDQIAVYKCYNVVDNGPDLLTLYLNLRCDLSGQLANTIGFCMMKYA